MAAVRGRSISVDTGMGLLHIRYMKGVAGRYIRIFPRMFLNISARRPA